MKTVMLLCDAAHEAGGKLYVLGGGWSILRNPGPATMALAIKVEVPWNEANTPHKVVAELLTEDGEPAIVAGNPVRLEAKLEVGRPVGLKAGTPLDAPLALNFGGLLLSPGGYRWEFRIEGKTEAEASFLVMGQ